jgi:hypothetical protein
MTKFLMMCCLAALTLGACSVSEDGYEVPVGSQASEVCTQVLCIEGYAPKTLPNCRQICVPDHDFECTTIDDCPQIVCITSPCPTYTCVGHHCVLGDSGSYTLPLL